jgi:hypothetical protein
MENPELFQVSLEGIDLVAQIPFFIPFDKTNALTNVDGKR